MRLHHIPPLLKRNITLISTANIASKSTFLNNLTTRMPS